LIGRLGVVRTWESASGSVQVDGALWRACPTVLLDEPETCELHPGDRVVVDHLEGLTVGVRRAEEWES
jgi:membrane protein implicated in regulation of membrane protease activity